jgi:LPS-assembly lipoprotein
MRSRRWLLSLPAMALLAGCGFQLRRAPDFAFGSIYVSAAPNSSTANEIRRGIAAADRVAVTPAPELAQVVLDLLGDQREKVAVGLNATGQVREFQLRTRLVFRLRTREGKEIIPQTELLQQRDISYNESLALAKEEEEHLLYRDMQKDIVQQLMRRLAAVKSL